MRKTFITGGLVGAAAIAATTIGIAGAGSVPPSAQSRPFTVSLLDRPGLGPDALPVPTRRQLALFGAQTEGVRVPDPAGAAAIGAGRGRVHRVDHPSGVRVFLVDAGSTLCMAEDGVAGAGLACGPAPSASNGNRPPISVTKVDEATWRVTALMTDGARDVSVGTAEGRTVALGVTDGVASASVEGTPSSFSWTDPDGVRREQSIRQ